MNNFTNWIVAVAYMLSVTQVNMMALGMPCLQIQREPMLFYRNLKNWYFFCKSRRITQEWETC
jgi:hypothetical protein